MQHDELRELRKRLIDELRADMGFTSLTSDILQIVEYRLQTSVLAEISSSLKANGNAKNK